MALKGPILLVYRLPGSWPIFGFGRDVHSHQLGWGLEQCGGLGAFGDFPLGFCLKPRTKGDPQKETHTHTQSPSPARILGWNSGEELWRLLHPSPSFHTLRVERMRGRSNQGHISGLTETGILLNLDQDTKRSGWSFPSRPN